MTPEDTTDPAVAAAENMTAALDQVARELVNVRKRQWRLTVGAVALAIALFAVWQTHEYASHARHWCLARNQAAAQSEARWSRALRVVLPSTPAGQRDEALIMAAVKADDTPRTCPRSFP